jgi:hypothetical protein
MRTTITLDKDVAALLNRVRRRRRGKLKELINEALRAGLKAVDADRVSEPPFRTRSADLGAMRIPDTGSVHDLLVQGEGEDYK